MELRDLRAGVGVEEEEEGEEADLLGQQEGDSTMSAGPKRPSEPLSRLEKWFGETEHSIDEFTRLSPSFVAVIFLVYFVQGSMDIGRISLQLFMLKELSLTQSAMATAFGFIGLPWIPKFLYGFMSDSWPLFGYRRRPYLFCGGLLACASYLGIATYAHNYTSAVLIAFAGNLGVAVSDVIVDAMVVERTRGKNERVGAKLQSFSWGSRALGSILASFLGSFAIAGLGPRNVFYVLACFPALICIFIWSLKERQIPMRGCEGTKDKLKALCSTMTRKRIFYPILFTIFLSATPSSGQAFTSFLVVELEMPDSFLALKESVTSIAFLGGVFLFQRYFSDTPVRKMLFASTLVSFCLGLTSLLLVTRANVALGIPDRLFTASDDFILTFTGVFQLLATLVLAARVCPPGIEGTMFATIMGLFNMAGTISSFLGAALTEYMGVRCEGEGQDKKCNFDNIVALVLICQVTTLLPLLCISWVPAENPSQEIEKEDETGEFEYFWQSCKKGD